MANEQNLMPIEKVNSNRTREQHKRDAKKGGVASGKARREKKAMKDTLAALLSMPLKNEETVDLEDIQSMASAKGKNITVQEAIMLAQIKKAMKGDTKAATFLRDTSGNKLQDAIQLSGSVNNPFADLTTEELLKLAGDD